MKRVYVLAVATLVTIPLDVVDARSDGNPNRAARARLAIPYSRTKT
jgi:hypothetical protein